MKMAILALIIFIIIMFIFLTIIIIMVATDMNEEKSINKQSSKKGKFPIWEKVYNPDGTFIYKIVGYSNHEQKIKYQPYQKNDIFTQYEYQFWEKLYYKCNISNLIVCPKVRMIDIVQVDINYNNREALQNKIQSKHVDFIICDSQMKVLAILEFDDNSNSKTNQQDFDFKAEIFNSLDIPLYKIKREHRAYDDEITRIIYGLKTMNGIQNNFKPNYFTETAKMEGIASKK